MSRLLFKRNHTYFFIDWKFTKLPIIFVKLALTTFKMIVIISHISASIHRVLVLPSGPLVL